MLAKFRRALKDRRSRLAQIDPLGALPGVASASELERMFERECARVDRNDRAFAMVVFQPTAASGPALRRLAEILRERLRTADVIGQLDAERLAALLPDTNGEGAWALADDVLKQLAKQELKFNCEVYGYPARWKDVQGQKNDESLTEAEAQAELDGLGELEELEELGELDDIGNELDELGQLEDELDDIEDELPEEHQQPVKSVEITAGLEQLRDLVGERPVRDLSEFLIQPLPLWKRAMDLSLVLLLLPVLVPVLLLAAAAVALTSPGPIIFRQARAGRGAKPFTFYKFRSMYVDAEARRAALEADNEVDGPVFKMKNDPRLTPVGRFLRKTSIDELPQLWNVVKGDMTLVGPRPPLLAEVPNYEPWQRRRLDLTGGLTCIWQVSGRSEIGWQEWVRMDLRYAKRRNFALDMGLLAKTAKAVVSGRGAY